MIPDTRSRARRRLSSAAILAALSTLGPTVTALASPAVPPPHGALGQPQQTATSTTAPAPTTTPPTTVPATPTTTPVPNVTSPLLPSTPTTPTTKARGVPAVPTGGPPTTAPANPAAPPPPPPDPGPVIAAVGADLDQISAIANYQTVKATVAVDQSQVVSALASLAGAENAQAGAVAAEVAAAGQMQAAEGDMGNLALAVYTGEAYNTSLSSPGVAQGTVSTLGALSGSASQDADVLLGLIVDHTKQALKSARENLKAGRVHVSDSEKAVADARAGVVGAQRALTADQQQLAVVIRLATVSGAASLVTTAVKNTGLSAAPTILGSTTVTGPELAAWFTSTGHKANATVPIAELAGDYVSAAQQTGVRGDLAFAQSIIETGFFSFPAGGQLGGSDNNFAGIGACDSCSHGWSFPDAQTGVAAQEELLEAYASSKPVQTPLVGPVGVGGCCTTWISLAGTWASSKIYGIEILTIYKQILDWVIPQRLIAVGLLQPASPTPTTATTTPTGTGP